MSLNPANTIAISRRSLRITLLCGLGTICAPSLRCEETVKPSDELGFGKPTLRASDADGKQPDQQQPSESATAPAPKEFPTGPITPDKSEGFAPLPGIPEWDDSLGTTPQTSTPTPSLIQPFGVSPLPPNDPTVDLTIPPPDFPESLDTSIPASGFTLEPETGLAEYRTPNASDFMENPSDFPNFPNYQNASTAIPSGFSQDLAGQPSNYGLGDTLLEGFTLAAFLSGTYDTNPSHGYSAATSSNEGDFYTTLGGTLAFRSKASDWTYGALYSGRYNQYAKQTELSGYNQNAGASLNYDGGRLSAGLKVGVDFGSGANRYYAAVVDQVSAHYALTARYQISTKTTIASSISQSLTSASGSSSSDTGSFTAGLSALWRYSPLTEFGPGISYSQRSGSRQQNLTSIGPTLTVNYKLSSKISVNSLVGLDFSEYENGQTTDPTVSANIGLNYRASALWGMNLSLFRNVRADPGSVGQYQEITSLRLGYNRKVRRAQWNLGASLQSNTSQAPNSVTTIRPDTDYFSLDTSLSMPIFANRYNASIFMNYSDQSGGTGAASWDSLRTGFSISHSF